MQLVPFTQSGANAYKAASKNFFCVPPLLKVPDETYLEPKPPKAICELCGLMFGF